MSNEKKSCQKLIQLCELIGFYVRGWLLENRIIKNDCEEYIECGCTKAKDDNHCMFCCLPENTHIHITRQSTYKRPFGFMRNFEWFIFEGVIMHNTIWIRVYPIQYGIEVKREMPLKWRYLFSKWSVKIRKATR